ncbi:MAG: hypothetical protein H7330_09235 [Hymenobacteraceae bacterium]|nr:hypothetical protein [Hymenobacteraceae bacterium]
MKKIILILLALLPALRGAAKCGGRGLWVWPTSSFVSTNAVFVLNANGLSQEVITNLNKKHAVYLISENQKVRLQVREVCVGQYLITQAVLVPIDPLVVGADYQLIIENLPQYQALESRKTEMGRLEQPHWKVSASLAPEPIAWLSSPKVVNKQKIEYGCGPERYVTFNYALAISGEYLLKTTIQGAGDNFKTTYYLEAERGQVSVGHGMCSGAFLLADNSHYEVTFDVFDAQGNVFAWQGPPIAFDTKWELPHR